MTDDERHGTFNGYSARQLTEAVVCAVLDTEHDEDMMALPYAEKNLKLGDAVLETLREMGVWFTKEPR